MKHPVYIWLTILILFTKGLNANNLEERNEWFVENWTTISIATDLTTFSTSFLTNLSRNSSKVSQRLRQRGATQEADELDELVKAADAAKAAKTFTAQQVETFASNATKQGYETKVILGKYIDETNPSSYQNRAKNEGYTYFNLEDWSEVSNMVGGKKSEIWRINKKFIDNQKTAGKNFYLSHDPFDTKFYNGYYKDELEYLTGSNLSNNFGGKIQQISENLWKINF